MNAEQVIRRPLITEKSTIEREFQNIVTFEVDLRTNKTEIRCAVEKLFDVQVLDVRTARVKGKKRRVGRNIGYRPNWKKARVRLREGDSIEFFEGI